MTTAILTSPSFSVSGAGGESAAPWAEAVESLGGSGLAHAPEWLTVIRETYGHDPLYLSAEDGRGAAPSFPRSSCEGRWEAPS